MNCLFEVLSIDNSTDFTSWIWCPIWCYNLDLRFTCIDPRDKNTFFIFKSRSFALQMNIFKCRVLENSPFQWFLDASNLNCKIFLIPTNRPVADSVDGFGFALGPFGRVELDWFALFSFDCRFCRIWPKNESPPVIDSSSECKFNFWLKGAVISGIPGKFTSYFASRFRRVGIGGSLNCVDRKSPYIRLINALFSSINSSIRSLHEMKSKRKIKQKKTNKNDMSTNVWIYKWFKCQLLTMDSCFPPSDKIVDCVV